jgi:hypothetical protein
MSRFIGKRVFYHCHYCDTPFSLGKKSVDDSLQTGAVFCSRQCFIVNKMQLKNLVLFEGRYWDKRTSSYKSHFFINDEADNRDNRETVHPVIATSLRDKFLKPKTQITNGSGFVIWHIG